MIAVAAFVMSAGAAWADNGPSEDVYGNQGVKIVDATKASSAQPKQTSGTLPFTGADLSIALVGGFVLLGTGFALRRASRQED